MGTNFLVSTNRSQFIESDTDQISSSPKPQVNLIFLTYLTSYLLLVEYFDIQEKIIQLNLKSLILQRISL